jgi:hypothetical protein
MKVWVRLIVLLILALGLGFYQEQLKISINYLLEEGAKVSGYDAKKPADREAWIEYNRRDMPFDYYHNHSTVPWLYRLDLHQLSVLKWIVTVFFLAAFCLFNIALLKTLQRDSSLTRVVVLTYGVLVPFAFLVYVSGRFTGLSIESYAFSRKILGALQSVIPAMIIWPAAQLWELNIKMKSE